MKRSTHTGSDTNTLSNKPDDPCAHRHLFHVTPPQGWMNDPNGFVYFHKQYHMFYQYNPYAPRWGLMHWGHCVSDDLLHWQHLPPALKPDQPYDIAGCFSGSSIMHKDTLYVFYTGVDDNGLQTQCLATSKDGLHFDKHPGNPLLPHPPDAVNPRHFRDPCVLRRKDRFFMVVGAQSTAKQGQAIVYVSDDLLHWSYLNTIRSTDSTLGYMWECPNLFFLDDQAILLLSPQGITGRPLFNETNDSGYFSGHFDDATGEFTHGEFRKLDTGFDFYAPQTAADPAGRRILVAWMSTWDTLVPTGTCQWAGSLTLPRELSLQGDTLHFRPVSEIRRYMKPVITLEPVIADAVPTLHATAGRLNIAATATDFSISVFCSADGLAYTMLSYSAAQHTITLDLSHSGDAARGLRHTLLPHPTDTIQLDIFLDQSSIEVFIGDGQQVMTARVLPPPQSDSIRFAGKATLTQLSLWEYSAPS